MIYSEQKENGSSVLRTSQRYNPDNQLTRQNWQLGSTAYSRSFTYNDDGSLDAMAPGSGGTLTMGYDGLRRLTSVSGGLVTRQYTYRDIDSTKTTMQVASVTSGGQKYSYTYDSMGNIASFSAPGKGTVTYTYDNQGQLLSAAGDTTYTYTYDGAGNILTASNGTTSHSYTYGDTNWKDLLTAFDGQSITYDAIGNPTSYYNGTRWTFGWANGRNLATASNGSTSLSFAYDSSGLRTGKTVNGTTYRYFYMDSKLMRMTWGSNTVDFFYDANGTPYSMKYNGALYYYVTNLQGDIMRIVNTSGTVVASYDYDPYGKVISATGTMANVNPLRYRGYVYDTETGFYYVSSRYYDPAIGRFINADNQIADVGSKFLGYNMFAYCMNNPINMLDSTGNWPKWVSGTLNAVGGALQVAAGAALGATVGWTGFGAVAAGFLIVNGTATVEQGIGQIVNDVTKSNVMREDNIIRTGVQEVGRAIGGDTGAKIAGGSYDIAVAAASIYAGKVGLQQAGIVPVRVDINNVVNNPLDEFVTIGPADGVIEQYCRTIPQSGYGRIYATQLGNGLYQIANGHHRVAALRALGYETVKIYLTK